MDKEPSAILQCDMTGEYLWMSFIDWRYAVHYLRWCEYHDMLEESEKSYDKWCNKYINYDSEHFVGDLNEFDDKDGNVIETQCGNIFPLTDLYKISAWTMEEEEEDD